MSEIRELYQEVILDHNKSPRNFRVMKDATQEVNGFNPLCGDKLVVYLKVQDGAVIDVSFQGSGCAISQASASMMTEMVKGKSETEAKKLFERFHAMLSGKAEPDHDALGKLAVFHGVNEYPARVKCATLAWHTLKTALDGKAEVTSTE
jgi:nitrogen fixation NifU-like protein